MKQLAPLESEVPPCAPGQHNYVLLARITPVYRYLCLCGAQYTRDDLEPAALSVVPSDGS